MNKSSVGKKRLISDLPLVVKGGADYMDVVTGDVVKVDCLRYSLLRPISLEVGKNGDGKNIERVVKEIQNKFGKLRAPSDVDFLLLSSSVGNGGNYSISYCYFR